MLGINACPRLRRANPKDKPRFFGHQQAVMQKEAAPGLVGDGIGPAQRLVGGVVQFGRVLEQQKVPAALAGPLHERRSMSPKELLHVEMLAVQQAVARHSFIPALAGGAHAAARGLGQSSDKLQEPLVPTPVAQGDARKLVLDVRAFLKKNFLFAGAAWAVALRCKLGQYGKYSRFACALRANPRRSHRITEILFERCSTGHGCRAQCCALHVNNP